MERLLVASLAALVGGCSSTNSFACTDETMCFVGQVEGECQPTGYCSFPDPTCPSGQRYGQFAGAGLADDCVPGDESTTTGSSSTSTTSMTTFGPETGSTTDGGTTLAITATGGDASTSGFVGTTTMGAGTDDTGTTTGFTSSNEETGSSTGTTTGGFDIDPPACADFSFGDEISPEAFIPDASIYGDAFPASCYPGGHVDVVFHWVAPFSGTWEFEADVDLSGSINVAGSIRTSCNGPELECDDNGGAGVDSRIEFDVSAGTEYLYIVTVNGNLDAGVQVSISPS